MRRPVCEEAGRCVGHVLALVSRFSATIDLSLTVPNMASATINLGIDLGLAVLR